MHPTRLSGHFSPNYRLTQPSKCSFTPAPDGRSVYAADRPPARPTSASVIPAAAAARRRLAVGRPSLVAPGRHHHVQSVSCKSPVISPRRAQPQPQVQIYFVQGCTHVVCIADSGRIRLRTREAKRLGHSFRWSLPSFPQSSSTPLIRFNARPSWRLAVCENRVTDPQFISPSRSFKHPLARRSSVVLWAALSTLFVLEIKTVP